LKFWTPQFSIRSKQCFDVVVSNLQGTHEFWKSCFWLIDSFLTGV
jgi:hypothetical protein